MSHSVSHHPRKREPFNEHWKFTRGDPRNVGESLTYERLKAWILPTGDELLESAPSSQRPSRDWSEGAPSPRGQGIIPAMRVGCAHADFDDSSWRAVELPHDWGIEGPFDPDHHGNTGKRACFGPCWYRKSFTLPASDAGRRVWLEIDGAMSHALVWCNGRLAGGWPNGYTSWRIDLTEFLSPGGQNLIAIRLDNPRESSRWYPGSGIYRNVWLLRTDPIAIAPHGVVVTTPQIRNEAALVHLAITLDNTSPAAAQPEVRVRILPHPTGTSREKDTVATAVAGPVQIPSGRQAHCTLSVSVPHPQLWQLASPVRYTAEVCLVQGDSIVDVVEVSFGIRTIEHTAEHGLLINGARTPIQGVCMHHDLGALGAAIHVRAIERQLEILRMMGCNAIRTSHNPPAPELLDLCDRMGMLVQVEAFDCWQLGKRRDDYSRVFDEWHEKDLRAMVRRDRNHPSVFQWSIGNEILEQRESDGWKLAARLAGIVREEDRTRPVVAGLNFTEATFNGFESVLDVVGYNYKPAEYARLKARHPHLVMMGAETSSTVSTRGHYTFPVSRELDGGRSDFQVSSYDHHAPAWATTPDTEWTALDNNPFVLGEFVWTGFDYLGEPTPYNSDATNLLNFSDSHAQERAALDLATLGRIRVPSRSSYFGIVDLAGFPKDRYYLYMARWRPNMPVAHLLPHWNWPERIGKQTPVYLYTSGDEAELLLNGKSQGLRTRDPGSHRLVWDDVLYEPGELRAVVRKAGSPWATAIRCTAGPAHRVKLTPDRHALRADGRDLSFIRVEITDHDNHVAPRADHPITFSVEGAGDLVATDNGDPTDHTSFQSPSRRAFGGLALAIVRTRRGVPGPIQIRATSPGLISDHLELIAVSS